MYSTYRTVFSAFVLTAALAASASLSSAATPQDHVRYYDREHRDYHNWDDNEDRSYRVYLGEQHREYHPFAESKRRQQQAYWNWRHSHPDHDGR
jgi:hypothetical protein